MGNAAGLSSTGQETPSSESSISPDLGENEYGGPWTEGRLDELAQKFEVSKAEMQLLWHRFEALGPDVQGCLNRSVFQRPPYNEDIFCRQIWKRFTGSKGAPHKITFQSFAHTMIWWQKAPINFKLELLFSWMKEVDGITPHLLSRILKHVLPDYQENELKQIAEQTIAAMNPTADPPVVKLKDFQHWMGQLPEEKLRDALDFKILHIDAGTQS